MGLALDLNGKVVLITGVASGIGAAIAEKFAAAGADIAGCDQSDATELFLSLSKKYKAANFYRQCDVTRRAELELLVADTIECFGKLDILVSNAGANVFKGASACNDDQWEQNMNLNLKAHWQLAQICQPALSASNGVIILMSSNHAQATIPGCFPYNITKTALNGLVRSLAIEWGPSIRTVGIAPGFIDTPGNQRWFNRAADPEEERRKTIDMHPVKRIGTPEEVGAWCVFLASEYAAFASGTTYLLDGGRSALL